MSASDRPIPAIDPDAARVLEALRQADRPAMETLTPEQARAGFRAMREAMNQPVPEMAEVRDLEADGPMGNTPLRLYRSHGAGARPSPVIVFFHGGGWVLGDLESHDIQCRNLANAGACSVVAVDYRLAPEHRFPAAVNDCIAAVSWVARHGAVLGVDPWRIAVAGDSAGGNLATVAALAAAASGAPKIMAQILVYPVTDLRMGYDSYRRVGEGYTLTAPAMAWFRDQYLNAPEEVSDWRVSPLLADNLAAAPPAFIVTAGLDPLCDEGEAYAGALRKAGAEVEFHCCSGQMHGFLGATGVIAQADSVLAEIGGFLKRRFAAE